MRYSASGFCGDEGVDYISMVCTRSHAFFLPRTRQDIGIDGQIELLDGTFEPTGIMIQVQCKAGISFITKTGKYQIRADKAHFETWKKYYPNPVIGIIYNPNERTAKWIDITKYLSDQPDVIKNGPYVITAPSDQVFDELSFGSFQYYMQSHYSSLDNSHLNRLIDKYLCTQDDEKLEILFTIHALYPWSTTACFFLHQIYFIEDENEILANLPYLLNIYRPHFDANYSAEASIPEHLKDHLYLIAQKCIDSFSQKEIIKMLYSLPLSAEVNNAGFDKGGIGYFVASHILHMTRGKNELCAIVGNTQLTYEIREIALVCLIDVLGFSNSSFLLSIYESETDEEFKGLLTFALKERFNITPGNDKQMKLF